MLNQITCPNCKSQIKLDQALTEDIETSLKAKYESQRQKELIDFQKKIDEFEAKKKNENELFTQKLNKEMLAKEQELKEKVKKESESTLAFYQKQQEERDAEIKKLKKIELEAMETRKRMNALREDMELEHKKKMLQFEEELKEKLTNDILLKERERNEMDRKEMQKKFDDQVKLNEQMRQKLMQGSMQTQGEVMEIALEEELRKYFPFDEIGEVGKGKKGGDCIMYIRNERQQLCGKIVFESKSTKEYKSEWVTKLKEDMMREKADMCILVTKVLPKEMTMFDIKDGVWHCRFSEVIQVVKIIREKIIHIFHVNELNKGRGEKKDILYSYFTGNEFRQKVKAINEAFIQLKSSIDKERFQMEKIWSTRQALIDKVLLNNNNMIGDIDGITGLDSDEINLLD